jgi:hypothetical protein
MAMVTLFQLFTLDKWYNLLGSLSAGMGSGVIPVIFVLIWILLGSFIFRNIFVGVMGESSLDPLPSCAPPAICPCAIGASANCAFIKNDI